MRFRIDPTNPKTFRRMVREGRGQGRGKDYKPWLTVRDLSSRGESSRMQGWRTGDRDIHLFSKLERSFLYTVEWDRSVTDYREQFLLDVDETVDIADRLGLHHPVSPESGRFWPMTTDLLVTKKLNGSVVEIARSVKPFSGIQLDGSLHPKHVKNNWEKFWIEFEYWKRRGVKLAWVTERDFSEVLAQNVCDVHDYFHASSLYPLEKDLVDAVGAELHRRISDGSKSLKSVGREVDAMFGLKEPGTSILVARHKIASGDWKVDFSVRFKTGNPLKLCPNSN